MKSLILFIGFVLSFDALPAHAFEQLLPVQVEGKWGYINSSGQIKIQPQFNFGGRFSDGLAQVGISGKLTEGKTKYGFINETGAYVVTPKYDQVGDFSEGYAAVAQGTAWGYIDRTGKTVYTPQALQAQKFSHGLAAVRFYVPVDGKSLARWGYLGVDSSTGLITEKIAPKFERASSFQPAGNQELAVVTIQKGRDLEYFFIYKDGQQVGGIYGDLQNFSEGLAAFRYTKDGKIGYLNTNFVVAITPTFEGPYMGQLHEGIASVGKFDHMVRSCDNGCRDIPMYKYGFIKYDTQTSKSQMAIDYKYGRPSNFSEGKAPVADKWNSKSYYIDAKGEGLFKQGMLNHPKKFSCTSGFESGIASFCSDSTGDLSYGYMNSDGQIIWDIKKH